MYFQIDKIKVLVPFR